MQTQVRKAVQLLLDEQPGGIAIIVQGDEVQRRQAAEAAVCAAWVNGAPLPLHKKKADQRKPLRGRAGQRDQRSDRVRSGMGVADVAG